MRCFDVFAWFVMAGVAAIPAQAAAENKSSSAVCDFVTATIAPLSVVEPCSKKLEIKTISDAERAKALYLRGYGYLVAKRNTKATADFMAGLKLTPNDNLMHRQLGHIALDLGEINKALYHAHRAAELYPKGAEEWLLLGLIHHWIGGHEKALAFFNKAIELKPDHVIARYRRASILIDREDFKASLPDTQWLIRQDASLLSARGSTSYFFMTVDYQQASYVKHAQVLAGMGKFSEGERILTDLVRRHGTAFSVFAKARYISLLPIGGQFPNRNEEAIALMQKAVELDPNFSFAWRNLATDLEIEKRFTEALAANETARLTNQSAEAVPMITWERARILRSLGQTDKAIELGIATLDTALILGPWAAMPYFEKLHRYGYWLYAEIPEKLNEAAVDAATACFLDPNCG